MAYYDRKKLASMQREEEIRRAMQDVFTSKKTGYRKIIIIAIILLCVSAASFVFFTAPQKTIEKPFMEKPSQIFTEPGENEEQAGRITKDHVAWVVNELGGYELHQSSLSEDPVMEVVVDGNPYTVMIKDNHVISSDGAPDNPDIRITTNIMVFAILIDSEDIQEDAAMLYQEGVLEIELLKDMNVLLDKGYKTIYDAVMG